MRSSRPTVSLLLLVALAGVSSAQSALKPPGGNSTFGAAPDQAFTAAVIFAPPAVVPV